MSLFSREPKNRRRRMRSKSRERSWDLPPLKPKASKAKKGDIVGQVYQLNAQIGALENFLEKKTAARTYREQLRRQGILPPPDLDSPRPARRRPAMSFAEQRRYRAERSKSGLHFLMLFLLACALGWWLIFSGI